MSHKELASTNSAFVPSEDIFVVVVHLAFVNAKDLARRFRNIPLKK
jgi:hypothetical protein